MLCILCITESDEILNIFDKTGLRLNISSIITKHFWLQPNVEDCKAKAICCRCWDALSSFHEFYQEVTEAHAKLINVKPPLEGDASDTDRHVTYPDFFSEDVKLEASEDFSAELPELVENNPVTHPDSTGNSAKTSQALKSDSEFDFELSNRGDSTKKYASDNDSDSDSSTNMESKLSDDSDYKPNKSKPKKRIVSTDLTFENKKISCKEFDSFIKKNMKLSCEVCHVPLATFFILKDHYRSAHNEVGYVNCCDKKFDSRHALVQHILLHENPEYYKCEQCGKTLANKKSLKNHMKSHLHKDRIYRCEKCDKSFCKKEKLEKHMKTHVVREQVCEHCGKIMRGKYSLKQHYLREHSGIPRQRVQCQKCGVYLADSSSLSFHNKYQHPKADIIYKCDICGKVSASGYGLKRHKLYMHQCERRHKCTLCEKGFKTAQILREHMTTHTGEVLYTCPHCPKTFNSNANMHSHRKKMHRKEWEENRRHPHMGSSSNAE